MEKLNGKIWVGFVINVLVALWGISDMATGGGTVGAIFITITAGGLLLTGAGMIMLAQGNPTGGILGAVGSAFFVPIGLICLIGCLQCRDRLRNEALADAPGSEETGTSTEEVSAVADAPVSPDGAAATNEAPTMMPAADLPLRLPPLLKAGRLRRKRLPRPGPRRSWSLRTGKPPLKRPPFLKACLTGRGRPSKSRWPPSSLRTIRSASAAWRSFSPSPCSPWGTWLPAWWRSSWSVSPDA